MVIPFTTEQFFNVFEKYNLSIFPFQLIIFVLGIIGLIFLNSKSPLKNKFIGSFLGFLWIWMGLVYHITFFSEINKVALMFGIIFIFQGVLILTNTLIKDKLTFTFTTQSKDYVGYFFIIFGLIIYPVISYIIKDSFDKTIALGLLCPTTIFTFGFFILANKKFPIYLLLIPTLWAFVGLRAAVSFGVYQDYMIMIVAICAIAILMNGNRTATLSH
jgi:hypothetical protein